MEKASLLFLNVARLGYPSLKSLTVDKTVSAGYMGDIGVDDTDTIGS
jgi:hypothetical protein